ncbi:unnamed protein product [Anisakis simplex]|uniref:Phosphoinositide phospholipase C n=1 Tax=Anisakis simplex TaxID=6269 RepID=A0A3P6N8M2_ANISI|nr:unnamed protein product [Anisakis simplex]
MWKLLQQLNLELSEDYARKLFRIDLIQAADTKRRDQMLDEDEFVIFFERLTERRDLRQILRTYSSAHQETFTPTDLMHFLVQQQHFEEIDDNKARDIVQTFERAKRDEQQPLLLGPLGFRHLLRAQYGNIFKPGHETVFQDMDCPLNYYYVNSSHNTYLTGLQLAGMASIEGYINALTKGARLLELDIFDGDDGEPCITHKHTLVDAIRLRDALTTIEQYAFKYSPYPVILTIENHVGLVQQKVMFRIFNEVFGDKIYISPPNSATSELPSPNALKNKFLVRGKKLPHEVVNSQSSDDDSAKQVKLDPEFSRLISLPSAKITNNADNDMRTHPMDGSPSLSESKVESIFQSSYNLPAYTARRFVKSYPSGFRQNSSNMDPFPSWLLGVQSVALNMQTADKFLDLNTAMFRVNGNCGYVLKPDILRRGLGRLSLFH